MTGHGLTFLLILISSLSLGQNWQWTKNLGGTGDDYGQSIATDISGNIYVMGGFNNYTDFDPNPGTFTLSSFGSTDIYLLKLNPSGNLLWAKQMGGISYDLGSSLKIDPFGNLYTIGWFYGAADFDPGPSVYTLTPKGEYDIFISKLDPSGNFLWAKCIGDTLNEFGTSIAFDPSGNMYATGSYGGNVDFDPNAGTSNLISTNQDVFVLKLNPSGNFVWARGINGNGSDEAFSITTDPSGNIYTTGMFSGTADFDPGPGIFNLTSVGSLDNFISKLDSSGNFVWANNFGGSGIDESFCISSDLNGNIYTTGIFSGVVDFDSGPSTFTLASYGAYDIFVTKYDTNGNFVWANKMGGNSNDYGWSISIDVIGNIFITGQFEGTADFDPGIGIFNLTSNGSNDIFILKLDPTGSFVWVKQMGGSLNDQGKCIVLDGSNNIYTTGWFYGTCDLNPDAGIYNAISNGSTDIFVTKIGGTVGLEENSDTNNEISIYPNPSHGSFKIKTEKNITNGELLLINSLGQTLFKQKITRQTTIINSNGLPFGLYNCILVYDNQQINCGRLVIE